MAAEGRYGSAVAARDRTRSRLAGGRVVVSGPAGVGGLSSADLAAYEEGRLAVDFEGPAAAWARGRAPARLAPRCAMETAAPTQSECPEARLRIASATARESLV